MLSWQGVMDRIRVLLVDDHTIVRQGLRCILATDEEIEVVGEAGDGRGGSCFNAEVSRLLLHDYLGDQPPGDDDDLTRLTGREREILQLIAEGRTNSEIAATLSLSLNTVETHRKQIMKKLDLHKTAELVRFALRKQVVN